MTIYTFGHSTLPISDALKILQNEDHPIDVLMDVRSHPASRWEQYWKENLERWLPANGIEYKWEPRLGGWTASHMRHADFFAKRGVNIAAYSKGKFPKQQIAPTMKEAPLLGPSWTNRGLYEYSWFTALPEFIDGAMDLLALGRKKNVAIMCCESLWWKCHRSMIADYLVFTGNDAVHLQPKETRHSASLGNRIERYAPEIRQAWDNLGIFPRQAA